MSPLRVEITTPSHAHAEFTADALDAPAENGRLTVLPGHAPLLCALRPGPLHVTRNGTRETWLTGMGTLMVKADQVALLVQKAQPPESSSTAAE